MNKQEILTLVEDYTKKLYAVDYWSGAQKSSSILNLAYESRAKLENIFGTDKEDWVCIDSYAKKLHFVYYWSGKQKSSVVLDSAYESLSKVEKIISELDLTVNSPKKKM